jgi:gliding motility-associated-like protein
MRKTLNLLFVFALLSVKSFSQYADLGTGTLKNRIWWFDWDGFVMANGASKTIQTTDGLTATITFSNITGPTLIPSVMNTWPGAVLHLLYNFSNPSIKPALYFSKSETELVKFMISIAAERNGIPVPLNFVVADAEASDVTEIATMQTNGGNWQTIDFFRNSNQTTNPAIGCNTKIVKLTDTYGHASAYGQNPVLSTTAPANGPLVVDVTMDHNGGFMGLAFGVLEGVDRGDLPASYGYALHKLSYTYNNVCNYMPPFPSATQSADLKLGNKLGDADGQQTLDDNADGADEDALQTMTTYGGNGSYQLTIPVTNTTGANAYLGAWFDFNENGVFDSRELSYYTVSPNATSVSVTFNSVPAQLKTSTKYSFRFRITSDLTVAQSATAYAKDGEVEDYKVFVPQAVQASFTTPDTVCVNTPVPITNTTIGATSYYWNFCVADLTKAPVGENLGNPGNNLSQPVFMDFVFTNGQYYGFLLNHYPGALIRLDFGNNLLNTPTSVNLGNFGGIVPPGYGAEGMQVVQNEGRWYVIAVGGYQPSGSTPRILKIDFGADITNTAPTATDWGNIGNMSQAIDLHVFKEGDNWYGLTVNAENNTITRVNFTTSLSNTPTAENLGNIGNLSYPTGIYAINDGGFWHVFVVNAGDPAKGIPSSLTRLDFGTSLLNTPTGTNLGNPGNFLKQPRDLTIMRQCGQIVGFAMNGERPGDLVKMDFRNNLQATPDLVSFGNIGDFDFPHSISKLFRVGDDVYSFVTNVTNNTITRLKFPGCSNASLPGSSLQSPGSVIYNQAGVYNINLTVDDGLPTQAAFCKQVVVVPSVHTPLQQKTICAGDSVLLRSSATTGNEWSTGSTAGFIYAKTSGTYWVKSTNASGCVNVDSFTVSINPLPVVNLGKDTSFCRNDSLVLNAGNIGAAYVWQNGQTTQTCIAHQAGVYHVTVTKSGCHASDSITISTKPSPVVVISGQTSICKDGSTLLSASGGTVYNWSPATGLSNPSNASTTASPPATTQYNVAVADANGCKASGSFTITVTPKPVFAVQTSKPILCLGDTAVLAATGGDHYSWSPALTLSDPANDFTLAYPTATTQYKVVIEDVDCAIKDSLFLTLPVADKPVVTTTKSNDINCFIGQATLHSGGGSHYLWSPANGLSDPTSSSPVVRINATTTYHLAVTTTQGCMVEDSITVFVSKGDGGSGFPVPNAFTPNGDGKNDCFGVKYWGDVSDFSMNLYNRWGDLVFRSDNPMQCWNGFYKGQLQPGDVYVYIIKANTRCGEIFRKGSFTLIR